MEFEDIKKETQVLPKAEVSDIKNTQISDEEVSRQAEERKKLEESQAQKDRAAIEAVRKQLAGETDQIENSSQLAFEFKKAEKASNDEIIDASCTRGGVRGYEILKLKLSKEGESKSGEAMIPIAKKALENEDSLKEFLSGELFKEGNINGKKIDKDDLKFWLESASAYFAFDSERLTSEDKFGEVLKKYASEYFKTKYSLELLKKAKLILKNFIPEIFSDFQTKFTYLDNFKDTHARGEDFDLIYLNYNERYRETNGIPDKNKGEELLRILHEYSHGIIDRLIDPEKNVNLDNYSIPSPIYSSLSEGYTLFIQDYVSNELEKNQKFVENNPELKDMIESNKKRIEGVEQGAEDKYSIYPEGWKITKKIFEIGGLEGYIKFLKSVDPEKAISISRDNPVYQEALKTGNPYKLLEIIGKK